MANLRFAVVQPRGHHSREEYRELAIDACRPFGSDVVDAAGRVRLPESRQVSASWVDN
jgi:hypothetical protein